MPLRLLMAIAASALLPATASATRNLVVTERDSGKTFTVRRGAELTLRLSNRYRWGEPKVRGRSVRLASVSYFSDPGFQEWEIRAVARGRARITATGQDQNCTAEPCESRRFSVVVVVRPRRS
jgi:predicted secreted protein